MRDVRDLHEPPWSSRGGGSGCSREMRYLRNSDLAASRLVINRDDFNAGKKLAYLRCLSDSKDVGKEVVELRQVRGIQFRLV